MAHAPHSSFIIKPHAPYSSFYSKPHAPPSLLPNKLHAPPSCFQLSFTIRCHKGEAETSSKTSYLAKRRHVIVAPLIAMGASVLKSAVAKAEENSAPVEPAAVIVEAPPPASEAAKVEEKVEEKKEEEQKKEEEEEEVMNSRIYDATVIGDPMVVGKESRKKVWEKLMNARVIYLGEAEQVPIGDDKDIELDIVKKLHKKCMDAERHLSLALEAFPLNLQEQLDQFMTGSINGEVLQMFVSNWAPERWQEYEPLLNYCRDNGVRLVACGLPLEILRTIQSEGIRGLPKADRKKYAPPAGSGFISGFTAISHRSSFDINYVTQFPPFEPSSYLSTQARAAEDYTMSQVIVEAVADGGASGLLVVVTGASHVTYGPRGTGVPARISRKMQKKNQAVILLNPERQHIRREGEAPVADLLWYSAARQCNRNCYDRAEIARVMNAAGRKRDALPQDLQKGLDLGLVSPEVLQNFFDLEKYPLISELTHRFQGFRERLLADPKFLQKLAIEEAISITTTLIAQYEKRKENFFDELDYVITDSARGAVVDFFTVWLPAPTLSFLTFDEINSSDSVEVLKGLLGSIPDNAFQKNLGGREWDLSHRVASVFFGGLKLATVGFVSSIGAVATSNVLYAARRFLNPSLVINQQTKRSPILKTAVVYGSFLGISANLRYQFIAGIVEHRISELIPDQAVFVNMLSFVTRTLNSYWGTQQWIDLARFTGLQSSKGLPSSKSEAIPYPTTENSSTTSLESNEVKETSIDEINQ